jgi:O-antigen/teichoic acid export membrane protein
VSALPSQPVSRSHFARDIVTILGGQAANVLIALLTEVCMARLLGPGPRGQISLCMMAVYFGALGGLGGETAIVRWCAGRRNPADWLRAILLWGLAGCAITELLWWILYSWLRSFALQGVTQRLALLVLLCIPLMILFNYLVAFLAGAELFRARAGVALLENSASLLGLLAMVWLFERSATAAMWGNWFGLAAGVTAAAILTRKTLREAQWSQPVPRPEVREGLLVGIRGQLGNVTSLFTYRLDVFIVNHFLNAVEVGIYAVGVTVSESLWQIPQAVATAIFPRTARTANSSSPAPDGDWSSQRNASSSFSCLILRQVFLISCVSGALLALASPIAIPLFFGSRFADAVPVIWWLMPGTVALAMAKVCASDLAGRGKTTYASVAGFAALMVTVALDLVLIPRMGIRGAALASSCAYFTNGALLLGAVRYELKAKWRELLLPSRAELLRYVQALSDLWRRLSTTSTDSGVRG